MVILEHQCFECGEASVSCVSLDSRRVKCQNCGIWNDFWLDDESAPANHMRQMPELLANESGICRF